MHQIQKEQIEQDRRHLQQMDETNEQLCQDLIHAEEELTLLRRQQKAAVDNGGEFDIDGPSQQVTVRSSVEREAALAWEERTALEAMLHDTQRELGATRGPMPAYPCCNSFSFSRCPFAVVACLPNK